MPNPTTNPTRLSRTAREVAWNPLPGDALRSPGGYTWTISSGPDEVARFLEQLAQTPAGITILPYNGCHRPGLATGADIERNVVLRDMGVLRSMGRYLPELLDRWLVCGGTLSPKALTALDFTADLPEAPFVHHAANVLHCMVKFGAPAFVAAKPARDPRNNPQPGDTKTIHWTDSRSTLYYDGPAGRLSWPVHMGVKTTWECGTAPAKDPYPGTTVRPFTLPNYFGVVDYHILAECAAALRSDGDARRCPRTDPRPGDICIMGDYVDVFTDGTSKDVWHIGGPRIRWIRAEDVVRG